MKAITILLLALPAAAQVYNPPPLTRINLFPGSSSSGSAAPAAAVVTGTAAIPIFTVPAGTNAITPMVYMLSVDVTSSTLVGGLTTGQLIVRSITQPGGGGLNFVSPTNMLNFSAPNKTASAVTTQLGWYDGTNVQIASNAVVTGLGGQGQGFTCIEGTAPGSPDSGSLNFYCQASDDSPRINFASGAILILGREPVLSKTANYTITAADFVANRTFKIPSGAPFTLTLPAVAPADGQKIEIVNYDASGSNITVARNGLTINGAASNYTLLSAVNSVFQTYAVTIKSDGAGYVAEAHNTPPDVDCTSTNKFITSAGGTQIPTCRSIALADLPAGSGGGGVTGWSGLPLTFAATTTQYAPFVGGGATSATETAVSTKASGAATLSQLHVTLDAALGADDVFTVTLENGTATASVLTCSTAAGGTSCDDITHSVNVADQALLSWKLVKTSGTVTAGLPQIKITTAVGTSGVGILSTSGTSPISVATGTTTPVVSCPTCGVTGTGLGQFAATSSATLRGVMSDETGTGFIYFQGGDLGTPSAGVGTNLTGIPTTALTGALQAAQEPAHTGDVTNSAGSLALAIGAAKVAPSMMKASTVDAQTDAATITWAIASVLNANASVTLGGNRTLNITNPVIGGNYVFKLTQDGTGSRTLTKGSGCTWKELGSSAATFGLSTTAAAVDILTFWFDGTNCYANVGKDYK